MKTNSKKYQENFKNYFLQVIESEDLPSNIKTDKDKINFVFDRFTKEYDYEYNRRRTPNYQMRLGEWLQTGALNIPLYYDEILELAKQLLETNTLKNEDTIKENYFPFMALQILRLKNKLNN